MSPDGRQLIHVDFFSGIGGFGHACAQAQFSVLQHYISEINKDALAVLNHHHPDAVQMGDVTMILDDMLDAIVETAKAHNVPILITGGFPCQDNSSLRGAPRRGLDGPQSGLYHDMALKIKYIKSLAMRRGVVVRILLENVVGISDSDAEFIAKDLELTVFFWMQLKPPSQDGRGFGFVVGQ